ncbi:DUF4038 domain-containing protein [uncultured Amaricoccus sp.]|uniref:apiosidase-like domain-containing protein n=1 Tax=uncultured Amaricoccus sp. TaxID=339341 RepID=UPI002624A8CA|nr:DUF4038 domain-containing protein [uncultured Amaricoccus sp.]
MPRSPSIVRALVFLFAAVCLARGAGAGDVDFPLRWSPDHRYLVDQGGVPFPILGRTSWNVTRLSPEDYRGYVDDTVARGYNAIEIWMPIHDPSHQPPQYAGNGAAPFLRSLDGSSWNGRTDYSDVSAQAPDLSSPNEAFWSYVDDLLSYCESRGVLVFAFPAYVGFQGGEWGWMQEMVANGPDRTQAFGSWIAERYRDRRNLVWMVGGDMGTGEGPKGPNLFSPEQTLVEAALIRGLKSVPDQASVLYSAEWASESIATDQTSFGHEMTLNGAYSWTGDVATHSRRAYAREPAMPAFLLEEPYDEEGRDGNRVNPHAVQPVRRFLWWGWLSSIGGFIAGNGYVWLFEDDHFWTWRNERWQDHLDTPGTRDVANLNRFVRSHPWHELVPSGLGGMRELIVSGGGLPEAADYVAAAAAPDGSLLVAYVPPAHAGAIGVDMTAMRGASSAEWFDPTAGTYVEVASGIDNSGSREFAVPGKNRAGERDWVLVLRSE